MRSKVLSCGIRLEDLRPIGMGVSITNQNNPMYYLWYNNEINEFGFKLDLFRKEPAHYYMNDLNDYINALADIIQAMAEANEFVSNG